MLGAAPLAQVSRVPAPDRKAGEGAGPVGLEELLHPLDQGRGDAALHDYRGYAGRVESGTLRVGDAVTVLPGGRTTTVTSNATFEFTPQVRVCPAKAGCWSGTLAGRVSSGVH